MTQENHSSRQEDDSKQVEELKKKAGDAILDTSDNVFSAKELKKIKFLEAWAILGPIVGILIGLIF